MMRVGSVVRGLGVGVSGGCGWLVGPGCGYDGAGAEVKFVVILVVARGRYGTGVSDDRRPGRRRC